MIRAPLSVLVTGSSGFIGTSLVRHLRGAGHLVTGIDIREPERPLPDGAAFHECNILTDPLPNGRFDAVVHLAALPGVRQSLHDPESYRRINVDGTVRLLSFCRAAGIPRFVFAPSSSVYGPETPLPAREDGPVDPCSPHICGNARISCGRKERACLGAPDFLPGRAGFAAEKSVKQKNAPFTGFGWGWRDPRTLSPS